MSPGGSAPLTNLVVQFSLQGQEALQQGIDRIGAAVAAFGAKAAAAGELAKNSFAKVSAASQTVAAEAGKMGGIFGTVGQQIRAALATAATAASAFGAKIADMSRQAAEGLAAMQKHMTGVTGALASGFAALRGPLAAGTASIMGFITAGLATGAMGQNLQFSLERLSRTISGLFRPEIEKVISVIQRVTEWFHQLSASQKDSLVKTVEVGAAMLAFATGGVTGAIAGLGILGISFDELGKSMAELMQQVARIVQALEPLAEVFLQAVVPAIKIVADALAGLNFETLLTIVKWGAAIAVFLKVLSIIPRVVAAIRTVIAAIQAMNVALIIKNALSGPAGWANLAAGATAAAAAMATFYGIENAAEKVRANKLKGLSGLGKEGLGNRGEDSKRLGGFENLNDTYKRIAMASRYVGGAVGKSPAERTVDLLVEANRHLSRIDGGVRDIQPPFDK